LIIVLACVLAIGVIAFVLGVRPRDLPAPEAPSPFHYLDQRKAAIYENLRDLQFEYRVGKLSDEDYQNTKKDLQRDLAGVLAEVDRLQQALARPEAQAKPAASNGAGAPNGLVCPACGAKFEKQLKFCGECGKPMQAVQA
jgi:hypothetical protein